MNAKSSVLRAVACAAVGAAAVVAIDAEATFTHYSTVRTESGGLVKYELYANFDGPTDTVLNAFHISLISGGVNFHHADFLNGGSDSTVAGTWNPQFVLVPGAMDSYVCIGGGEGFASGNSTAADPDWGAAGFNSAQIPYGNGETSGPGWFNQNPPNLQGRVNASGQVKLGQFVIALADDETFTTIRLKFGYNDGIPGSGIRFADSQFRLVNTDCDGNGIEDRDELAAGLATDCDGDFVLDICEGLGRYDESQSFGFSGSLPVEVSFTGLFPAYANGVPPSVEVLATADLGGATDGLIVQLDGGPGTLFFLGDGHDCPDAPDQAVLRPSFSSFNALIADGELRVRVSAVGAVSTASCPNGEISIRLVYDTLPSASDCNGNGILDSCEIGNGALADCNENNIPDACEIDSGAEADCNANGTPDSCELAAGTSTDLDGNGVLDGCAGEFVVGGSGFASIQQAINAAPDGATVLVGPGSYGPLELSARALTIRSIGGAAVTDIDGGGTARCFTMQVAGKGETLIEGFTFRNGFADCGAAVRATLSAPVFVDCMFTDNATTVHGGAIALHGAAARFIGCDFLGNATDGMGGAVFLEGEASTGVSTFESCLFEQNSAGSIGGAIVSSGLLGLVDCVIERNTSVIAGGGATFMSQGSASLAGTRFCLNTVGNVQGQFTDLGGNILSQDCDGDGLCDYDEILGGSEPDCDGNGFPDACDLAAGTADCNENGVPDSCDIAAGTSPDLDGNGQPDECSDCDLDGIDDPFEIAEGLDTDCNGNGVLDFCEIGFNPLLDDDGDGRLDSCEFALGDINLDGVVDGADLAPLLSLWGFANPPIGDLNGDGVITGADLAILLDNWGTIAWSPVLSQIEPPQGPSFGGSTVTLRGASLGSTTAISFGGVAVAVFEVIDETTITVVTPPHAPGTVPVEVVTELGSTLVPDYYEYVAAAPAWSTLLEFDPDPNLVFDDAARAAMQATGLPWRVRDTATGIEMLLVPPGTFDMGCIAGSNDAGCYPLELPVHEVVLTGAFYLGRYEVTQSEWIAVTGANPSFFQGAQYPDAPVRPVDGVTRSAVDAFMSASGLRLPTEAEWEYACRAGTTAPFHSGPGFPSGTADSSLLGAIAWYTPNASVQTHAVGGKAPNAFGFHDMLGNVWEWVSDWYDIYGADSLVDPTGPASGTVGILRGGSFNVGADVARASYRLSNAFEITSPRVGVRAARNPS